MVVFIVVIFILSTSDTRADTEVLNKLQENRMDSKCDSNSNSTIKDNMQ